MINIKHNRFNKVEILSLVFVYLLLGCCVLFFKDSPISLISAFFGITYTFLAGKGYPMCYLFGLTGSLFYGYLAFKNALWGNLILYLAYYVPMQIIGFFKWNSHLKTDEKNIVKISLSNKEKYMTLALTLLFTVLTIITLYFFKDNNPIIDGITTIFSITGMYLTVRRAIEQWQIWMIVNGLSLIMWFLIALNGEKVYCTIIMWLVYFICAIYFYFCWKKELRS